MSEENSDFLGMLASSICESQWLEPQDHKLIHELCNLIRVEGELVDTTECYKNLSAAEAGAVFIKSKYRRKLSKIEAKSEAHRIGKFLELGSRNDENLKWGKNEKLEYLLASDGKYKFLTDNLKSFQSFYAELLELVTVIFRREKKLEQIAINNRQDNKADYA